MDNYEKHLDAGERLGKKGDELEQYVQKRVKQDDERAEREFKRQLDSEERRAKHAREEHKRKSKGELQQRQYEAEERDRKEKKKTDGVSPGLSTAAER